MLDNVECVIDFVVNPFVYVPFGEVEDGNWFVRGRGCFDGLDHLVRVWRSTDSGKSWELIIDLPDARGEAPVTINKAADGTPYIVTNKLGHERDWLCVWPLS